MTGPGIEHAWISRVASVGLLPLARLLHDRGRRPLVVLAYSDTHAASSASNPGNPRIAPSAIFESQMLLVAERCMPTASGDVASYLSGRAVLPRRAVVLAFEACDPHLALALPILQRRRIPATVLLRECDPGAPVDPMNPAETPVLSGVAIRRLATEGIEFGLRWTDDASSDRSGGPALPDRLLQSRLQIEALTGAACRVIAFRGSSRGRSDVGMLRAAGLAGFRLALSDAAGANWLGALDPFGLRCQRVALDTGLRRFRSMLELADWVD